MSGMEETGAAEGREIGLGAEGQRGSQTSVGAAAVRSGALDCCQLSCLTFLRSVGGSEQKRGEGQRETPGIGARAPSTVRGSRGTPDPQAGPVCPTRTVRELRD